MRLALPLAFVLALGACRSADPAVDSDVDLSTVPCTCGEEITAVEGCAHPLCVAGERNPENPECVCGSLVIEEN